MTKQRHLRREFSYLLEGTFIIGLLYAGFGTRILYQIIGVLVAIISWQIGAKYE